MGLVVFAAMCCLALGVPVGALAASGPAIASVSASYVGQHGAGLQAWINPEGLSTRGAVYQFQVVTNPSEFLPEIACPIREHTSLGGGGCVGTPIAGALPIGSIPAGTESRQVYFDPLSAGMGLEPGTTYHFRVLAATAKASEDQLEWEAPPVYSEERTFTTKASSTPPVLIESEAATHISSTDATLQASINPENVKNGALYQFQLVGNPGEYFSTFVCPPEWARSSLCLGLDTEAQGLPFGRTDPGTTGQTVSLDLAHAGSTGVTLKPGTTYHYRVIATTSVFTEDTTDWEGPTVEGADQTFTTPPSPPVIESESVSHITATDTTIEAQINTGGRETTYRVWVGNYPECIEEMVEECDSSAKHPIIGTLAGSSSPTRISVDVAQAWHALSPGSSYIYNVDATNSNWAYEGSAYGENKTFMTPAAKAPAIDSVSVSHVTPTDATLEAQINTDGLETSYEFHLATPPCPSGCEHLQYGFPLPSGRLLGSSVTQSVSLDLNSAGVTLTPGQRYEYWVTATNAAGTASTLSQEKTFAATEDGVQPLNITTPPSITGAASNSGQGTVMTATGGSTLAVNAASKPAHEKPSTKHGKRRKHKHHGKHLAKGHKKKH